MRRVGSTLLTLPGAFAAGLVISGWIPPITAAVVTIAAQLMWKPPWPQWLGTWEPAGIGLIVGLTSWVVLGIIVCPIAGPRTANGESWGQAMVRSSDLAARVKALTEGGTPCEQLSGACDDVKALEAAQNGWPGLRWATRSGYIVIWQRIHHAEETLIEQEKKPADLWRALQRDRFRLEGAVGISPSLAPALEAIAIYLSSPSPPASAASHDRPGPTSAAAALQPEVAAVAPIPDAPVTDPGRPIVESQPGALSAPAAASSASGPQPRETSGTPVAPKLPTTVAEPAPPALASAPAASRTTLESVPPVQSFEEARYRLREVTAAINAFRDSSWAGLVRLRNLTLAALIFTESFAYAILALVVSTHVGTGAMVAGVTFFLVAGVVGLFNRLVIFQTSGPAVNDYGVQLAQLLLLPVVSGLAGLGGVVLGAMLFSTGFSSLVQASATRVNAPTQLPHLSQIFDLAANPAGIIFALVFGYAPVLLVSRLDDLAATYKTAIKSTETSTTQRGSG